MDYILVSACRLCPTISRLWQPRCRRVFLGSGGRSPLLLLPGFWELPHSWQQLELEECGVRKRQGGQKRMAQKVLEPRSPGIEKRATQSAHDRRRHPAYLMRVVTITLQKVESKWPFCIRGVEEDHASVGYAELLCYTIEVQDFRFITTRSGRRMEQC
jgi:hypothetical protein